MGNDHEIGAEGANLQESRDLVRRRRTSPCRGWYSTHVIYLDPRRTSPIFAITGARNDGAWHVDDVTCCDVKSQFLNGHATWLSFAIDLPPTKENCTIRYLPRNRLWRSTRESLGGCDALSSDRRWPFFPTLLPLSRLVIFICHFTLSSHAKEK